MICPFCGKPVTRVRNSRSGDGGHAVRRRRLCESCGKRFTTFERVQLGIISVEKSDGKKQPFDLEKLIRSIHIACRKRLIDDEQVSQLAAKVQRKLEKRGERSVTSARIGNEVMKLLRGLDDVAYVRFASVYHNFENTEDFRKFISAVKK